MTYFPSYEEAIMIWQLKISIIYFFGDVNDEESAGFFNDIMNDKETEFSLINLKE